MIICRLIDSFVTKIYILMTQYTHTPKLVVNVQ